MCSGIIGRDHCVWDTLNDFTWGRKDSPPPPPAAVHGSTAAHKPCTSTSTNQAPPAAISKAAYVNPADHSQYYKLAVDQCTVAIPIAHTLPTQLKHPHSHVPGKGVGECGGSRLISAAGYPRFTNYTFDFKDCLDYIFVDCSQYTVTQVLKIYQQDVLRLEPDPGAAEGGSGMYPAIPSRYHPSDHIPIVCDLTCI